MLEFTHYERSTYPSSYFLQQNLAILNQGIYKHICWQNASISVKCHGACSLQSKETDDNVHKSQVTMIPSGIIRSQDGTHLGAI